MTPARTSVRCTRGPIPRGQSRTATTSWLSSVRSLALASWTGTRASSMTPLQREDRGCGQGVPEKTGWRRQATTGSRRTRSSRGRRCPRVPRTRAAFDDKAAALYKRVPPPGHGSRPGADVQGWRVRVARILRTPPRGYSRLRRRLRPGLHRHRPRGHRDHEGLLIKPRRRLLREGQVEESSTGSGT